MNLKPGSVEVRNQDLPLSPSLIAVAAGLVFFAASLATPLAMMVLAAMLVVLCGAPYSKTMKLAITGPGVGSCSGYSRGCPPTLPLRPLPLARRLSRSHYRTKWTQAVKGPVDELARFTDPPFS